MLGSGTYTIVKEAIHIKTGKYYACKVINKKLMEGREHMVRNEIAVLKRISSGNPNVVTLHDYFEVRVSIQTSHNLYLCFDLCTGGELFDRICAKGNYYEADAASLVRTILTAVAYIHKGGIVYRDLKPENLLFRTPAEDADIMIADFGLSRIMEMRCARCVHSLRYDATHPAHLGFATPLWGEGGEGVLRRDALRGSRREAESADGDLRDAGAGHSKPVDVWAMGVVTYFLLAGYTPFDRDTPKLEMEAIIAGDYKFEPEEYWANVSDTARDFVRACLTIDPERRPTAAECLDHKWLASNTSHFVSTPSGSPTDLLPHVKKVFNAKLTWKKAAFSIKALHRMTALAGGHPLGREAAELRENVQQYKEESAQEVMEDASITHHHNLHHPSDSSGRGSSISDKLAKTSLEE
ncbi:Pkinase-domain-containing protein [Mycena albidolilacea]|uniref:Pkinase-domain-containing protein n=1 Tax=Mycena albidolilacea TaxID=1033008 RepID=A0AAD6ZH17_9AGAR|nr:Pkinase-domain-containing protein [Mycena albidolilacea]